MKKNILDFIQQNSPDGGFLQSEYWKKFQEVWGRKTLSLSETGENGELVVHANIIAHKLPIVGDYFYIPRGPVLAQSAKFKVQIHSVKLKTFFSSLVRLAEKNKAGWIRIEPNNEGDLKLIQDNLLKGLKIKKSSVDMQPREILILDILKSKEEILTGMKQKTRYNIRLAEKKGVKIFVSQEEKYINEFCRLVKVTAKRDGIASHPEKYYRKMFETISGNILKLYVAEYEGKIIAANLVLFFGKTATYMHGASDNMHRDAMAPYLLQWQAIQDAKKAGYTCYDFGGVKSHNMEYGAWSKYDWAGITKFKTGFAPNINPIQFPGCYDIIRRPGKYNLYRVLQKIKRIF